MVVLGKNLVKVSRVEKREERRGKREKEKRI